MDETFEGWVRQVRRRIELERQFGFEFDPGGSHRGVRRRGAGVGLPPSGANQSHPGAGVPQSHPGRGEQEPAAGVPQGGGASAGSDRARQLGDLAREMAQCAACPLGRTRTNLVFGVGDPEARLVFVGEAPGEDEDLQGIPFVGRAGQLLTKIIENGMKMQREEVYICNVLKCRPPGNRNPSATEIFHCLPYLERQLEIIHPRAICALGAIAAQALLNTDEGIGRLRGRWFDWRGIPMMVTYHPAYLLRTPAAKTKVWSDIQLVMAKLAE